MNGINIVVFDNVRRTGSIFRKANALKGRKDRIIEFVAVNLLCLLKASSTVVSSVTACHSNEPHAQAPVFGDNLKPEVTRESLVASQARRQQVCSTYGEAAIRQSLQSQHLQQRLHHHRHFRRPTRILEPQRERKPLIHCWNTQLSG